MAEEFGGSVGEDLLAQSQMHHASILIMGAYMHGRLRQSVYGGVTREVLHYAALPVLLAH